MNWYLQSENDSDVVISTRIRYARNLENFKFNVSTKEEGEAIQNEIKSKLPSLGYGLNFCRISDIDDVTKMSLLEKNIISPECVLNKYNQEAILINEDENICIMINEEDHIRLQVFSSSFDLENTFNLAKEIDEKIDKLYNIAKNKKYGYLTACPTNVGTGLRASVMLHLPGLTRTNNIKKILDVVSNFGVEIRGIYGENSRVSADMYQISNKQTLGISEEAIIKNLKVISEKIIKQEREARKILTKNQIEFEDMVYRSFGILKDCRKISSEESRKLLSDIKLGTDLGVIKELNDLKVKKLFLYTKPYNLQKEVGENLENYERDIKRAEIIKKIINE